MGSAGFGARELHLEYCKRIANNPESSLAFGDLTIEKVPGQSAAVG